MLDELRDVDLALIGFDDADQADLRALIESLADNPQRLARVGELAEFFRGRVGDVLSRHNLPRLQGPAHLEQGLDIVLALLLTHHKTVEFYERRGIGRELGLRSTSDLAQQVRLFRRIYGSFGITTSHWPGENYTGRHLWLRRLGFTLEKEGDDVVVGIHVPDTGRLDLGDAIADIEQAQEIYPRAFPEFDIKRWHIHSWMMHPRILEQLSPESNIRRFADLFEVTGELDPELSATLFFLFDLDTRLMPTSCYALPNRTSLERAGIDVINAGVAGEFNAVLRADFASRGA